MHVTGLGQCSLDNIFLIDSFPLPDTKKEVLEHITAGGGPVATALASLSRLGVDCSFYGIVGDDEAGEKIARSLQDEKVKTTGLLTRAHAASQHAFITVEQGTGRRTIFWKRPSCRPLAPEELPDDFLERSDFLLLDGLMAGASLHAARLARQRNIPVMLDAGRLREGMMDVARISDYVVASEEFARQILPAAEAFSPESALKQLKLPQATAVTITLGIKGSVTLFQGELIQTPSFSVDVVDTTGAGDVFHGGYIYGLLQEWDMEQVLRFASACAALKCRRLGGRAGIASLEEVQRLVEDRNTPLNSTQ